FLLRTLSRRVMENRIYVGNLSDDVSVSTLRKRFAEFGDVRDVELPMDRASGRVRGHAFVTMASAAGAQNAVARLNGALFDERRLRVSIAGEEHTSRRTRSNDADGVRIMNQFRERNGMVYELRCGGLRLALKMFADDERQESWRVEGSIKRAAPADP